VPEAVANPWQGVVRPLEQPHQSIPPSTTILELFEENGRSLLILGQPGSGKTVLLLQLAQALLEQAKIDANEPVPVVFNLSSWANQAKPLAQWLVDELNEKYLIPCKIGQDWVASDRLLLLLDGLDEVATDKLADCITTINQFRQTSGLVPIALCCRSQVYENIHVPVRLNGAISIHQLTSEQADLYLDKGGEQLIGLQQAIHDDPVLQGIAASPLMLQVMSKAFRQEERSAPLIAENLLTSGSQRKDALLATIFSSYVN
jgi:hypothetical protein